MQPFAVALAVFNRVTEGMAKIQYCPATGLTLILGNDVCFELSGAADCIAEQLGIHRQQACHVHLQPAKEL